MFSKEFYEELKASHGSERASVLIYDSILGRNVSNEIEAPPCPWEAVGKAHQLILAYDKGRDVQGSYFTPPQLVREVVRPVTSLLFKRLWNGDVSSYVEGILSLRLVDPAMGVGYFLRQMAYDLASEITFVREKGLPRFVYYPDWEEPVGYEDEIALKEIAPDLLYEIYDKCIFGLDLDPVAVSLGRRLIAQECGAETDPTFMASNIKHGNALVGQGYGEVKTDMGVLTHFIQEDIRPSYSHLCPHSFDWPSQFPEPFDAVISNPPFAGRSKLRSFLNNPKLLDHIRNTYTQGKSPDYAGMFLVRFSKLIKENGVIGVIVPNGVAQATGREVVMRPLLDDGFFIYRAEAGREWPSDASVSVSLVHMTREPPKSQDGRALHATLILPSGPVQIKHEDGISSYLDEYPDTHLYELPSSDKNYIFTGMLLRGNFSIHREPGQSPFEAIENIPEGERDALRAYLNAHSIQQRPKPTPADVVIDFFDPLQRAGLDRADAPTQLAWLEENYPETLRQLRERSPHAPDQESVYEQRMRLSDSGSDTPHKTFWWLYGSVRQGLRADWRDVDKVIAFPRVVKIWSPFRLDKYVSTDPGKNSLVICPMDMLFIAGQFTTAHFTVASSFLFEMFTRRVCSTLGTGLRFTPTDVLPYFPWPWLPKFDGPRLTIGEPPEEMAESLSKAAEDLLNIRTSILEHPNEHGLTRAQVGGPTDLYNLYDSDPDGENPRKGAENLSIEALRQAHVDLFDAVLRAYGWDDIAERCTRQDWVFDHPWLDRTMRFVPPESIRAELFQRINDLNAERYELEREMIISFIVENLPDQGLTKTSFGETAPFSEMNITSDQFDEFMQWELDERQETSRVRKDGQQWRSARVQKTDRIF